MRWVVLALGIVGFLLACLGAYDIWVHRAFRGAFPEEYEMGREILSWPAPDNPKAREILREAADASRPPWIPFGSSAGEAPGDPEIRELHDFWEQRYGWAPAGLDNERATRAALSLHRRGIGLFVTAIVVFIAAGVLQRIATGFRK